MSLDKEISVAHIQGFLPRGRRLALTKGQALPEVAVGTCLFADLSGFTPMSESLGKSLGPRRGAEVMTELLNQIFEHLVTQVHRFGGEIINFGGDAITCWFPELGPAGSAVRVIHCALAMQQIIQQYGAVPTPDGLTHTVSIKIGLAHGTTRRFLAGSPVFGLIDSLTGATVVRMAAAEHLARSGEILCAPEMVELLGEDVIWGDERNDFRVLLDCTSIEAIYQDVQPVESLDDLPIEVLRDYFPPAVLEYLVSMGDALMAELRPVVCAFVHFEGLDYDYDPQVGAKLNQYVTLVQEQSELFGGHVIWADYGDKGSVLMVVFGAPSAHEDEELRAVRWALSMQEAIHALPFITNQSIGMNQGSVYVGALGARGRRGFTLIGDVVNTAARLMSVCQPGQILVSQRIQQATQKRFMFHQFPGFQVKGKFEPVPIAMPVAPLPATPQLTPVGPILGRKAELAQVDQMLSEFTTGSGRVMCIEGSEGVGKTRLATEIVQRAMSRGVRTLVGGAESTGQRSPYLPWREILRTLFGLQSAWPAINQAMQIQNMLQWINPEWLPLVPLLGDLLGLEIADTPITQGMDLQKRRAALFNLIGDLLKRMASQQPVLVLVEDCHWMDASTAALIEHLSTDLAQSRLALVITHRPMEASEQSVLTDLGARPYGMRLHLAELSNEAVRQMIISRRGGELPENLMALIEGLAQGNPLFVEELVETIYEVSSLRMEGGRWVLDSELESIPRLPANIHGVVLARLDRLDDTARAVVKVASVVGGQFEAHLVAHLSPGNPTPAACEEVLIHLERRGLLRSEEGVNETTPGAKRVYIFRHNVTREVAYETLLYAQRRELHRLVAEWYEEKFADSISSVASLLAFHFNQAEVESKAVDYLLRAGDLARSLYANSEAIRYYQDALDYLRKQGVDTLDITARTLMKLGLTHHTNFDFSAARQAYEEAFLLWQQAGELSRPDLPEAPHPLRLDYPYMPLTLDPAFAFDTDTFGVIDQLFCGLVALGPGMEVLPDVAERWEIQESGKRYVFHLRSDVFWSDGTPLTAEDFVFAWKRVLQPENESPAASMLYVLRDAQAFHQGESNEVGVWAQDKSTLVVELEQPIGYFLYLLTCTATFAVPRHTVQEFGPAWTEPANLVTCGPFHLVSWEQVGDQEERLVLGRSSIYHSRWSGNVRQVELLATPEPEQRAAAYENGERDVLLFRSLPQQRSRLRQRHAGEYLITPYPGITYLGFNIQKPPFNDLRVRKAFVMAVDREQFASRDMEGFSYPGMGGFLPPGMPGHSPGLGLPLDVDAAQQFLAAAGYPGGQGFPPVTFLTDPSTETGVAYLVAQWRKNLNVEIPWECLDFEQYDRVASTGSLNLFLLTWVADYPDPDNFLRCPDILGILKGHPTYWEWIERARQANNPAERLELYTQADRMLVEEAYLMPFFYLRSNFLIKPWVKRFPTSAVEWWYWKDVIIEPHTDL